MKRKRSCEICGQTAGSLLRVDAGTRIVVLCETHAQSAARAGASDTQALRALFPELDGRRSLLARRASDERRLFPPRPEGRRQRRGRRTGDRPAAAR